MAERDEGLLRLVIIGGGGHASVVLDAALASPRIHVVGYVDRADAPRALGVPYLGDDDAAPRRVADVSWVLGVGALRPGKSRPSIAQRYEALGARFAAVVHPSAVVSLSAVVQDGAVVLAGAIVNPGARVGAHAIVNTGAVVEHDVEVGAYAVIAPGAVLGGGVTLGEGAHVGLGARVRDHVTIGARAMVGMGAVVVSSVDEEDVVLGIPARRRAGR